MDSHLMSSMTSSFMIKQCSAHRKVRAKMLAWVASLLLAVPGAQAAEVPGFDRAVVINAREQPVGQFLTELFGQLGVPARVSDTITGSVNGDFRKEAREVFHDIASSFQLSIYYDGAIAHIYPSNDVVHNILYMPKGRARDVEHMATKMGMADQYNNVSVSDVGLVVTGAPRFMDQMEEMSAAMRKSAGSDTATPAPVVTQDIYRTFQLRYAWADDVSLVIGGETVVVPGVATIIRSLIEPGAFQSPPSSAGTRIPGSSTLEGLRGKGLQSVSERLESQGNSAPLLSPDSDNSPTEDDGSTASTRIVADPLSNSVIIRDKASRMKEYEELIKSLDKEQKMIEIEATIIDLDTDKLRELGINWRLSRGDGEALLGDGTFSDELLRPNTDVTPRGEGGFISLVLGSREQFIARIRALETQGAARIVSKPHVMTLSNVEALLDTTSTFFVRVAGEEEVDLFNVSVGTTLRVTPHVYDIDGRSQIKLRVNIEDGSTSDRSVDSIPIIENSTITTQAIIDVGQSLLIGGLVRETKGNGTVRVPVLGRIPFLGALFRTTTKTSTRNERMFLITPRVTNPKFAGKRFSAPILSGSEEAIIQSAPNRLFNAEQALNLREDAYPLERSLPRGDGLKSRQPKFVEPLQSAPSNGDTSPETSADLIPDQPASLRERLFNSQPQRDTSQPRQQHVENDDDQADAPDITTAADFKHDPDDGWQAISASPGIASNSRESALGIEPAAYAGQSSAPVGNAHQTPAVAEDPVDADGWQVVN